MKTGTHLEVKPKKFEFMKWIFVLVFVAACQVTAYCEWMVFLSYKVAMNSSGMVAMDMTPFAYIVPGWCTILASVVGFYSVKAKAENEIKLSAIYAPPEEKIEDASSV